jgi:hypothetical protein
VVTGARKGHKHVMDIRATVFVYAGAAIAEIAGCFAFWA